jgi:hypothetical protein
MAQPQSGHITRAHGAAAVLCLIGCAAAIAGDLVTVWLRDGLNPIENTISRAAKGEYAVFSDTGLSLFAAGAAALAVALADLRLDGATSRFGAGMLVVTAIAALFLALWNQYDRKHADDFGAHMIALYVLAAAFPVAAGLLAQGLARLRPWAPRFSLWVAGLWLAAGPVYFLVPDDFSGLFERLSLMLVIVWFAAVSLMVLRPKSAPAEQGITSAARG